MRRNFKTGETGNAFQDVVHQCLQINCKHWSKMYKWYKIYILLFKLKKFRVYTDYSVILMCTTQLKSVFGVKNTYYMWRLNDPVVRMTDSRSLDRGFDYQIEHCLYLLSEKYLNSTWLRQGCWRTQLYSAATTFLRFDISCCI